MVLQLDNRKMKILELIIDAYIKSGDPVGSKTVSQLLDNKISSATVRNEMAVLYDLGYLEQPYTSAGRVPSQLAYRLYIDQIMQKKVLSQEQLKQIEAWFNVTDLDYTSLIQNAGKMLSQITSCMTVLSSMTFKDLVITNVEVIEIANRTLAIIVLTSSGIIKSKVCRVNFDLNVDTVDMVYRFVNNAFGMKSVEEISQNYINAICSNLESYHSFFIPIFYNVYEMCCGLQTSDFYIDGQTNLLYYKELKNVAADVIKFLNDKNTVNNIINNIFENVGYNNVAYVKFGRELKKAVLSDVGLIVAKYDIGSIGAGAILVVGPDRLDYASLVPWVEYFSEMLSVVLSRSLEIT